MPDPPPLTEFPEFREPRRVDDVVLDANSHPVPSRIAMAGQGHLGVLEGSRRQGYDLVSYGRTPWAASRTVIKELWAKAIFANSATLGDSPTVTGVDDDAGTTEALHVWDLDNNEPWVDTRVAGQPASELKYGSDGSATTQAMFDIQTQIGATITNPSTTWDAGNEEFTVSGSRVHNEANATATEIAYLKEYLVSGGTIRTFLLDRAVLGTPVSITSGQTVAITYVWGF